MALLWSLVCACVVLASGGVYASDELLDYEVDVATTTETPIITTWQSWIRYGARIGTNTSITLSRRDVTEECYLVRYGETTRLKDVDIEGVQVYPESTPFVSCRVVIGPMVEELLGEWTLCGRHRDGTVIRERCQPTNTFWAINNPSQEWTSRINPIFNHPVHFGGQVNPTVRGTGTVNTCHAVTPFGEDIVLTATSDYPGIDFVVLRDLTWCSVNVTRINDNYIGTWEVYGTYNHSNFNVVHQPLTFFIFDEENPYNQAYNVTNLHPAVNITRIGNTIQMNVTGSNTRVDCLITTNTGETYNNVTVANLPGVSFMSSNNAICRFQIGPISKDMLGDWSIRGRFRRNWQLHNETRLNFTIMEEDPYNPFFDESRELAYLSNRHIDTRYGSSHSIVIDNIRNQFRESCHIRLPDGRQFMFMEGFNIPGVTMDMRNAIACGVTINVQNANMVGQWVLIARINGLNNLRIERRQPFTIYVDDPIAETGVPTTWLNWIHYGARIGSNTSITLSRQDYTEECFLIRDGKIISFEDVDIEGVQVYPEKTPFVSCRVVIGPMVQELLGEWSLCGRHEEGGVKTQRCQPTVSFWAIANPSQNWQTNTMALFNHPVHFGGLVNPIVRGSGTLNTCHAVTPFGEDIVVTRTSDYPGISLVALSNTDRCSVNISQINQNYIGPWEVYATFNSSIQFNVVHQPMTFFIFDEENPYNQAYNATTMHHMMNIIRIGNTIQVNVTGSNTRMECLLTTNTGQVVNNVTVGSLPGVSFIASSSAICRFQIGPITEDMLGEWFLRGRFSRTAQINNEIRLPFTIALEDPYNPYVDETRTIEYLRDETFYSWYGANHQIIIENVRNQFRDSCHLRVPDGRQFILMQGFDFPGVTMDTRNTIACGVTVNVQNEDHIGEWVLIARVNGNNNLRIERRQPFTIHVEDYVAALPNTTTIVEGNDLFLRLENPASVPGTCGLEGPSRSTGEVDENLARFCGFIVRDVTLEDTGRWNVTYGNRIKYKAFVDVTVTPRTQIVQEKIFWAKDSQVNQTIGPDDTVYCRILNPRGTPVVEGFGRCNIFIDRVTTHHHGTWKMIVGREGRILMESLEFNVEVTKAAPKAEVITSVETEKPHVLLSCGVATEEPVTACNFRDPTGRVLLATRGVGEDRFTFHGVGVSMETNTTEHQCGLRITDPVVEEMGLWRCAVETEADTYYGFLTVLCPFAMGVPEIAAQVTTEPVLVAASNSIEAVEEDPITMQCSINYAIRYCYFRRQNGTVFSITPDTSGPFEYVGAGLDAGDCGIRFPALMTADAGTWSCHVGFYNTSMDEQRANFFVDIDPLMTVEQFHQQNALSTLIVRGQVHSSRALSYCRFVRMDGVGFTTENLPEGYRHNSKLNTGLCELHIDSPSILERHPWTVAVRIQGQTVEIERSTDHTIEITTPEPEPETETPEPEPETETPDPDPNTNYVPALPSAISVAEGNDMYLRLENAATLPTTCGLEGPSRSNGVVDELTFTFCGFIVREVTQADSGRWYITYGNNVRFRALINVTVTPRVHVVEQRLSWTKDAQLNQTIGPEDTIYCRVLNPQGLAVFEGLGRCNIFIDRVTAHHEGMWKMTLGTEGRMLTETHQFFVTVVEAAPKAQVITSVHTEKPHVMLTCSVATSVPVTTCKFRDPAGRIVLASQGIGEDRFTFYSMSSHQCGLRITDPLVSDLGLWRCALETEADIYYGFLTVLCPFAMSVPGIAAQVTTEPVLVPASSSVKAVEGDDVNIQCSINSAISYCYFRRQNGTVFSVSPGTSGAFEYVGAGLDAGDCGIRFPALLAADGGTWSCHVGFYNRSMPEQRASFAVDIDPLMTAEQFHERNALNTLVVRGQVHSSRSLNYCRFVRMDGFGFTTENLPQGYRHNSNLNTGLCELHIDSPSILERHPWTVAVRIQGQTVEIERSTDHTLEIPLPDPVNRTNFVVVWSVVITVTLIIFFVGMMLSTKKNRQWTFRRAAIIRDSFRNSFRKKPISPEVVPDHNTPTAA